MKYLIATICLVLAGCGVAITQKNESFEEPHKLESITVVMHTEPSQRYSVKKYSVSTVPLVNDANRQSADVITSALLKSADATVAKTVQAKLAEKGVSAGDAYQLKIAFSKIEISVQGDGALLKVDPKLNIEVTATLLRKSDGRLLWYSSFRRPNGSTSPEALEKVGGDVAIAVADLFLNSGWAK